MRKGISNTLWILAILALAGFGVFKWQESTEQQQAALDAQEGEFYFAPNGEYLIQIPKGWTLSDRAVEQEGSTFLELRGPRNDVVEKIFQLDGGEGTIADAVIGQDFTNIIDTPSGRDYALLVLEITSGLAYKLPESKTPYKESTLETESVANGIAYGKFNDLQANGGDGYKFDATVSTSSGSVDVTNFYMLGDLAEIDGFFYPANSSFAADAEAIIKNTKIFSIEELEEAALQIDSLQDHDEEGQPTEP